MQTGDPERPSGGQHGAVTHQTQEAQKYSYPWSHFNLSIKVILMLEWPSPSLDLDLIDNLRRKLKIRVMVKSSSLKINHQIPAETKTFLILKRKKMIINLFSKVNKTDQLKTNNYSFDLVL